MPITPENNNRVYHLKNSRDVDYMFLEIKALGNDVAGTKEMLNTRIIIKDAKATDLLYLESDMTQVEGLLDAIYAENENYRSEVYDSRYYVFLKEAIMHAVMFKEADCKETRRNVVTFPATHCFETIQVLERDGEAFITVNMRSCNALKNLMCDLFLAYKIGLSMVPDYNFEKVSLVANIGSLHIFEEDIRHVL